MTEAPALPILDTLPVAVFLFQILPDGLAVRYANTASCDTWGVDAADLTKCGARLWDLVLPDDAEGLRAALESAARDGAGWRGEFRVRNPRKGELWLEGHATPAAGLGGGHVSFVASDITLRKQAEADLKRSRDELNEVQRTARIGLGTWDVESDTSIWSEEAYRIAGWDPSRPAPSLGERRTLYTPESWARLREAIVSTLATGIPFELDLEYQRPCGAPQWVMARGTPVRNENGQIVRLSGTVQDITERVLTDLKMRSMVTAIEQAAEQFLITDTRGIIQYCNPAFERTTGYARQEAVGQNPRILNSGQQKPEFYRHLWATIINGEVWSGRFVNRKKDGTLYQEDATISPILDAARNIVGFVAVKRDVTERLNIESHLRQAHRLESIGTLAGGLAHDFNNLLTVINGYSDLLLRGLPQSDPLRLPVSEIRQAGACAAQLTGQLLTFSRKQVVELQPVDLNVIVDQSRELLAGVLGADVELVTQFDSPDLALGDPGQIQLMLMNLVLNARDAMPGGGTLTIETASTELRKQDAAAFPGIVPGRYVRLTVRDTGVGIAGEVQDHIFEPFFTTKPVGQGAGLGLSTVYGIVRQAGGSIAVKSEPGAGAAFEIHLPRAVRPAPAKLPGKAPRKRTVCSETILAVEDQAEVRNLAAAVLRKTGYTVLCAASGDEAVRVAGEHMGPIHLLLTDVVMPHMTGKELAVLLAETRPEMKVLFMSGYAESVVAERLDFDVADRFLAKPFTPAELTDKLRAILTPVGEPRQVLVVDDDEHIRRLFRHVLSDAGYGVVVAANGNEALAALHDAKVDLVITDLVMPEREGIETIEAIRQQYPGLKIAAISGAFGGAFLQVAKAMGADATLQKPVSPDELLNVVRDLSG